MAIFLRGCEISLMIRKKRSTFLKYIRHFLQNPKICMLDSSLVGRINLSAGVNNSPSKYGRTSQVRYGSSAKIWRGHGTIRL